MHAAMSAGEARDKKGRFRVNGYGNYQKELQNYREQSINMMTKGEVLTLLYDEIIKKLGKSKLWLEQKKFTEFNTEIDKTRAIVLYLSNNLDHKYPVSSNLFRLYDFVLYDLSRLAAGRNPAIIDEIIPIVSGLRDAFKEADIIARTPKSAAK